MLEGSQGQESTEGLKRNGPSVEIHSDEKKIFNADAVVNRCDHRCVSK